MRIAAVAVVLALLAACPVAATDRAATVAAFPTEFGGRMDGLYLDSGLRLSYGFCMTLEAIGVELDEAARRQLAPFEPPPDAVHFTGVNSYFGDTINTVLAAGAFDPATGEVLIVEIEGTQSSETIFTEGAWVGIVGEDFTALEAQWVPDWNDYRSWLTLKPGCSAPTS